MNSSILHSKRACSFAPVRKLAFAGRSGTRLLAAGLNIVAIALAASFIAPFGAPAIGQAHQESATSGSRRVAPAQVSSQSAAAVPAEAAPQEPVYANLHARAWKILDAAVASDKVRSRSDALSAISILASNPHAVKLMVQRLDDKDEGIRTLAANSLGDMKSPAAIPALRKATNDPSPVVSFAAAKSLWKLGDRRAREMFYEVLAGERKTGPGFIKSHVNDIKKEIHDPKALALIGINQASGAFLGPFSMGISVVEEYAKDTSSPVQALCANLLSQDPTPDTVEQLSLALDNDNWTVRAAAAKALAEIGDRKVMPKLDEMMNTDKEPAVRLAAAAAIVKLTR